MIEAKDVVSGYGNLEVLHGVSARARKGEITCFIGPNGSGKSTLVKTLAGVLPAWRGRIFLDGEDVTDLGPDKRLRNGMTVIPQGRRVFPRMTVKENLEMGAYALGDKSVLKDRLDAVYAEFPVLRERQRQLAATLSGGEQTMLCIARGLILNPKVLVLDEPSLGLAPTLIESTYDKIREINQAGTTIVLVEQNVRKALSVADWVYVLDLGMKRFEGTGAELLSNDQLVKLYLGRPHAFTQEDPSSRA